MFQKIAKHRANDAFNDVHRPPLDGGGDEKGEESPMDGLIGWTRLGKKRRGP